MPSSRPSIKADGPTCMLLLPLHRPLTRATFPVVTALLVVVNVFVYFGWQSGDNARIAEAVEDYAHSRLGEIEAPAYERWLIDRGGRGDAVEEYRDAEDDAPRRALVATNALFDPEFVPAMETGRWFPDGATFAEWRTLRPAYDETLGDIFTLRHLLRASEVSPARMVTSAFLHGDAMHLFGNMVFLVVIGLLVEGAIGPWRFGVVYLLGAIGASAASLVFHWGDAAGGLGASGAIAALMGCFCLVWGLQPVRFFYWIGVWFDYVRAPAVWLFPAWLGWEVFNLVSRDASSNVAFEAHAGGLVCGAAMGWILSATGQVRHEFIRDDASGDAAPAGDDRWERAQRHMGRMQLSEADQLLDQLATEAPWRIDVQVARYRVAYNGSRTEQAQTRAVQALSIDARDAQSVRLQADLFLELARRNAAVPPTVRLPLARRCIDFDLLEDAERALQGIPADVAPDVQSQLWFELALRHRDAGAQASHVRCLRHLSERHPQQPQAVKAKFLLENA